MLLFSCLLTLESEAKLIQFCLCIYQVKFVHQNFCNKNRAKFEASTLSKIVFINAPELFKNVSYLSLYGILTYEKWCTLKLGVFISCTNHWNFFKYYS